MKNQWWSRGRAAHFL